MNYAAIAAPEIGAKAHAPEKSATRAAPRDKAPQQPLQDPPGPPLDDGAARRLLEPPPEKERDKMHGELSGEGELYRRKLILKLKSYATSFPDVCGELLKDKSLEHMDTRQLEVLLNEVKFTVGAKTSQIVTGLFSAQMLTLPQHLLAENTPLYVEGPAVQLNNLAQSKDYQDLVKELTLEYADWVYQKPENRFMAYMANSIMTIHNINSNAIERGQPDPKLTRKRKRVEEYEKAHEEKEEKEPEKKMPRVEGVEVVEIPAETPVAVAKAAEASPKPAAPRDEFGYELPKGAAPPKPKPKPAPTPATGGRPK